MQIIKFPKNLKEAQEYFLNISLLMFGIGMLLMILGYALKIETMEDIGANLLVALLLTFPIYVLIIIVNKMRNTE